MIIFVSNFLNHHQFPVASHLYKMTDGNYRFIETEPMPEWIKKGGYSEYRNVPWLIKTWSSDNNYQTAKQLILDADVVVRSNNMFMTEIKERLSNFKITFEVGERWLKRGLINLLSPRLLKSQFYYHCILNTKSLYHLNASAYAATDFKLMRSFKNKMFKWGYFTAISHPSDFDVTKKFHDIPRILFVARFLKLKHPDLPVIMASRLKNSGYDFELNMFGSGPELDRVEKLIHKLRLDNCVKLLGNRPNAEILSEMRQHDIFLFTSDRHEGWGAVVNEAMSSGCAVVSSDAVGSAPFLIKDGENGVLFKSGSADDLTAKVEQLLSDHQHLKNIGINAFHSMHDIWSPENAARNFLILIESLLGKNNGTTISNGPCSQALPI